MKTETPRTYAVLSKFLDVPTTSAESGALMDLARDLERELARAERKISSLKQAVSLVSVRCEHMHHEKKHRHGSCEKCPVEELFIKLTE